MYDKVKKYVGLVDHILVDKKVEKAASMGEGESRVVERPACNRVTRALVSVS